MWGMLATLYGFLFGGVVDWLGANRRKACRLIPRRGNPLLPQLRHERICERTSPRGLHADSIGICQKD
jgi:hypothetical protein